MSKMARKSRDMSQPSPARPALQVAWPNDPAWKTFGDRLDFLSPERQHLATQGRMRLLPPRNPEKRKAFEGK